MVIESKPDALVAAMASILADEPRRQTMSERARLLAATTFDWETIARRTLALCREVIAANQGAR
jgi:glycosyltransferase involved in cell wall biosynthesis